MAEQSVLFLGGTGEISRACVEAAVAAGHRVTVLNRGTRGGAPLPTGVRLLVGDVNDEAVLAAAAGEGFDVVCQFLGFVAADAERDVRLFGGRCAQYLFVSSASAYRKPWHDGVITEATPLDNPFLAYSRNKAACEAVLTDSGTAGTLPVTIVRPSHTYRERLPSTVVHGDHLLWRLRRGRPVLVHDDGASLWTLTHAADFARAFVGLFGRTATIGEAYHITDETAQSWRTILETIAGLAGEPLELCSVPSAELAERREDWAGPLLGDKANSLVFDNTKIAAAVSGWRCEIGLREGLAQTLSLAQARLDAGYAPPEDVDRLVDAIVAERTEI